MTARPVVVVGDVGVDLVVRTSTAAAPGGDTPSRITQTGGGAGGNSATWLAAYDVPVVLVARVGDDAAGGLVSRELDRAGVQSVLTRDPSLPTCTVVSVVEPGGARTMLSDRGAGGALTPEDVDLDAAVAALPADAGMPHLHLSGFVLFAESSRAAGRYALADARRRGWTTSVDPQAANLVAQVGRSTFLEWVAGVDLLLPNAPEAETLGGVDVMLQSVHEVVVTHGADGAEWASPSGRWSVHGRTVAVVDTTGCGDAFNAGLLSGWLTGADRRKSLRLGVEAGTAASERVGARP